jgi:transposase
MYLHANAKLGLAGRLALVRSIEDGCSLRVAAAAFSVSPATAHRWWHRWLEGGRRPEALLDRSSRPHRSPRLLAAELQERICACRRQTGWGPRLVAGATGFAHSTVWKVLKRAGLSRRAKAVTEPANSYEWPCPGDLLHMDTSRYARFLRPGHRVTGDRSQSLRGRSRQTLIGYDFAHAIVDDHSRLAYVELHDDEKAATVTAFVERGLAFFRRAWGRRQAADDRQRLKLRQEPLAARTAHPPGHPSPHDPALPATHQWQGRALPPDDGARVGLRGSPTAHIDSATRPCHTGSTITTGDGRTVRSETGHRSAAFTTSVGRTASSCEIG